MPPASGRARSPRTLGDLGEFPWIARLRRQLRPRAGASAAVSLGIGDDAAIVRLRAGEELAVSTDAAVEGVHFDFETDAAVAVGRRALAAALSDLAAMGARPLACTLSLAAPPSLALRRLDAAMRGFADEAAKRGAPLVGGNLARARETSLHATVLGAVARGGALRRDAARAGDALFVTGTLGAAAIARRRAQTSGKPGRRVPPCRLAAGRALARLAATGARIACVDLSDGLASDLPHLLGSIGGPPALGAEVELAALPRSRGHDATCRALGLDPALALCAGGEDYELLFTVDPRHADAGRLARRLGVSVAEIGRLTARRGVRGLPPGASGWRHF